MRLPSIELPNSLPDFVIFFKFFFSGYGFVDFETPQAAEYAVQELQACGYQAQMAKVGFFFYIYILF